MAELMFNWLLLWGCYLLHKWGRVGPTPTLEGIISVVASFAGLYFWIQVIGQSAQTINDVFFYWIGASTRA